MNIIANINEKPNTLDGISVLVVEDFEKFAVILKRMLLSFGCARVETVSNGDKAIETLKRFAFDAVICDYKLHKGPNGQAILQTIRDQRLLKPQSIFVFATGENHDQKIMSAIERKPDAYIVKPFSSALLKRKMLQALTRHRALAPFMIAHDNQKWDELLQLTRQPYLYPPMIMHEIAHYQYLACMNLNQLDDALMICQQVAAQVDYPWCSLGQAEVAMAKSECHQAERLLKQLIKSKPSVMAAYDMLSKVEVCLQDKLQAQSVLCSAVQKSPMISERQMQLGDLSCELNDLDQAKSAYRAAIDCPSNNSGEKIVKYANVCIQKLGDASISASESTQLLQFLNEAIRSIAGSPAKKFELLLLKADIYLKRDNQFDYLNLLMEAFQCYQQAPDHIPSPKVWSLMLALIKMDEHDKARQLAQKIMPWLVEDSDRHQILQRLYNGSQLNDIGIQFFESGQLTEAVILLQYAMQKMPNHIPTKLNLLQTLLKSIKLKGEQAGLRRQCQSLLMDIAALEGSASQHQRASKLQEVFEKL